MSPFAGALHSSVYKAIWTFRAICALANVAILATEESNTLKTEYLRSMCKEKF